MSDELVAYNSTAVTLYANVRKADGTIWNTDTAAFEAYNALNVVDYAISLTDESGYLYLGDFPVALGVDRYTIVYIIQAGGTPAVSDTVHSYDLNFLWDGTSRSYPSAETQVAAAHTITDAAIAAVPANVWNRNISAVTTSSYAGERLNAAARIAGLGTVEGTVTVQTDAFTPISGAIVWLTTDLGGSNKVAGAQTTDVSGNVDFLIDGSSTYYLWVRATGYTSVTGDAWDTSSSSTITTLMSAATSVSTDVNKLTLSELRTEVRKIIARDSTTGTDAFSDSRITQAINFGQRRIADIYTFEEMFFTYECSTVASTYEYGFPDNMKNIFTMRLISGTQSRKLEAVFPRDFDLAVPYPSSRAEGKSEFYVNYDSYFELYPIPDAVYTLRLRCSMYPADLTVDTDTSALDRKDELIICYAASYCLAAVFEESRAEFWNKRFTNLLQVATATDNKRKDWTPKSQGFSGKAPVIRNAESPWSVK